MNTSATLAHLSTRFAHVTYDLDVERNAVRNGYGDLDALGRLTAKQARLERAVLGLCARRDKQHCLR